MKLASLLTLLLVSFALTAQQQDYFVLEGNDTVQIQKVRYYYTSSIGKLSKLVYYDLNGKEITLKKNAILNEIICLYIDGVSYDKVDNRAQNMRADKVNYLKRETTGTITCWILRQDGHVYFKLLIDGEYFQVHRPNEYYQVLFPVFEKCPKIARLINAFEMPKKMSILTKPEELQLLELIIAYNENCGN